MAPLGIIRSSVTGGGDCRTLPLFTIPFRSSDVASGVGLPTWPRSGTGAEVVRRCLVMYDADRGNEGLEPPVGVAWKDDLRLASGEVEAEDAGDRWEGGVYGIPKILGLLGDKNDAPAEGGINEGGRGVLWARGMRRCEILGM